MTDLRFIIKATDQDNQDLLDLSRLCPMKSGIKIYTDRSPDFLNIYKILDDKSFVLIEKTNNKSPPAI